MCLHARSPNAAESKELVRWLKRPRNAVQMRRGQLVSLSAQGMRVQEISDTLHLHEEYVRQLIRQYNEWGIDGFAHACPSGASFEVDAGRRIRGGGNRQDASPRVLSTVQPVVVAQADRLPGGTTDDSQGLACDHRENSGPA